MLFACLDVIKTYFEKLYTIPTTQYYHLTYFMWAMMGHMSVVLSKLCLFEGDGWDPDYARSTFNFLEMVETVQMKVREAKEAADKSVLQASRDRVSLAFGFPELFLNFEARLQQWKEVHLHKLQAQAAVPPPSGTDISMATALGDDFLAPGANSLFDFLDNEYWLQPL